MDRHEKARKRARIAEHIDVSRARLTDAEVEFLSEFVESYDDEYRGRSTSRTRNRDGWSSDGRYRREETFTDTFMEETGIRRDYSYRDDDGDTGGSSVEVRDARGILDWFKEQR